MGMWTGQGEECVYLAIMCAHTLSIAWCINKICEWLWAMCHISPNPCHPSEAVNSERDWFVSAQVAGVNIFDLARTHIQPLT